MNPLVGLITTTHVAVVLSEEPKHCLSHRDARFDGMNVRQFTFVIVTSICSTSCYRTQRATSRLRRRRY